MTKINTINLYSYDRNWQAAKHLVARATACRIMIHVYIEKDYVH